MPGHVQKIQVQRAPADPGTPREIIFRQAGVALSPYARRQFHQTRNAPSGPAIAKAIIPLKSEGFITGCQAKEGMNIADTKTVKKILIIDDNELVGQSLKKTFGRYPVEVHLAVNSDDAITEISSNFYDLCMLDLSLPYIGGVEMIKRLRSISPATKIAVMAAPPISDDSERFVLIEANYYIEKPFDLADMKMLAAMLLDRNWTSE